MKKLELMQLKREIEEIIEDKISTSPLYSRSGSNTSSSKQGSNLPSKRRGSKKTLDKI